MASIAQGLAGIKDASDLIVKSRKTGKVVLSVDFANTFSLDLTSDSVSAKKKGADAVTWEMPREMTLNLGVDLLNSSLMAMVFGSDMLQEATEFMNREVFDIKEADPTLTLKKEPKDGKVQVVKIRKDGVTHIEDILDSAISVATKNVTITGLVEGDKIAIYYLNEEVANKFSVGSTKDNAEDYEIYAITTTKSYESGSEIPLMIKINKATVNSAINFEFSAETPSSFNLTMKCMVDENNKLFDWVEIPVA